jgi:hypothetical protein
VPSVTDPSVEIAKTISEAGWRTGTACSPTALDLHRPYMPAAAVARMDADQRGTWIPFVASQTCDLVNGDFTAEPHAEFILGQRGVREDPNLALRRSWRRLQLRHPGGDFVEFCFHEKWVIPRSKLVDLPLAPDLDMTWHQGIDLAKWIGGRYSRYPLPDALVHRLEFNTEKPKRWLKALTEDIEELRIQVTPPDMELMPGTPYNMVVYAIQTARGLSTTRAKEAYDHLNKWLSTRPDVNVQLRLVTPDTFTYAMMKNTHHFDVDAITFGYSTGPRGATGIDSLA